LSAISRQLSVKTRWGCHHERSEGPAVLYPRRTSMKQAFRIAIGRCDCGPPYRNSAEERVCQMIYEQLGNWRERIPAELTAIPAELFEERLVEGRPVTFGMFRFEPNSQETLVVCQALIHTWSRPTFLSVGAVGRMYAEGLLVNSSGDVEAAPDEFMWQFR
jgi:hypothetical protein